jgi:hypothetical protein
MHAIKIGILAIGAVGIGVAVLADATAPHQQGAAAAAASPRASMAPREEYLLDMRMAAVSLAQAHAANMCGLRSDGWLHDFDLGYQYFGAAEVKRLGIASAGISKGDKETAKTYRETMGMMSCRVLTNSQTMAYLDDMQSQMTGGYH